MIVHDSAISICYAMLCYATLLWLLWLRLWLWRGAMRERETWLLCGVSMCGCECRIQSHLILMR
jgi:hypothetical protein